VEEGQIEREERIDFMCHKCTWLQERNINSERMRLKIIRVGRHLCCHRSVEVAPLAWSRPVWCVTYQCDPSKSRSYISYVTYTLGVS